LEKSSNSPEQTISIGVEFSKQLKNGDVIAINGEIGAGKTTFIKGVLQGLGYSGSVTSPTYTLINEYQFERSVIHIDCYREKDIERWLDIGIMEYINSDSIVIIEWSEYIKKILPINYINISIQQLSDFEREISVLQ